LRAETLEAVGHHQPKQEQPLAPQLQPTKSDRVRGAVEALRLLSAPRLVMGFHPDQATDAVVDLALALRVPFAVVPCCTFPSQFPQRMIPRRDPAAGAGGGWRRQRKPQAGRRPPAAAGCTSVALDGVSGEGRGIAVSSPPQPTQPQLQQVRSYDDLLEFLCAKHPSIRRASLDFGSADAASGGGGSGGGSRGKSGGEVQPRNTVLYMLPSDFV
jgi:hypothetical protein